MAHGPPSLRSARLGFRQAQTTQPRSDQNEPLSVLWHPVICGVEHAPVPVVAALIKLPKNQGVRLSLIAERNARIAGEEEDD